MELIFASTNAHKTEEVRAMLGHQIRIKNLSDLKFTQDIAETADTFAGNASLKSHYIADKFQQNCFGDDSGLEIDALNGEPGVYSARYSGSRDFDENMNLVLRKMDGIENRTARFKTVISLILDGKEYFFEGSVEGIILSTKSGSKGFGYDPIFQPEGYEISFAEMSLEEKNRISHRARALGKMVDFLNLSIS